MGWRVRVKTLGFWSLHGIYPWVESKRCDYHKFWDIQRKLWFGDRLGYLICVCRPPLRSIKKKSTDLEPTGGNVLSLGASGLSLNLLRGGRQGDETEILLNMNFSMALSHCCPLLRSLGVVLEPPKDRTNCPLLRSMSEIRFASGASAQALHGSLWLKTGHTISTPYAKEAAAVSATVAVAASAT